MTVLNDETHASELENEGITDETVNPDEEGTEPETQPTQPSPEELQKQLEALTAEKEKLAAEKDRLAGRLGAEKSAKVAFAKALKKQMEEGLIDDNDLATATGLDAKRVRGMIEAPDVADNPLEAAKSNFNRYYVELGFKSALDEVMGEDTGKYAKAFGDYATPDLISEFQDLEPSKSPAFVVKKGKELLERYGEGGKDGYIARLEAELEQFKAPKEIDGQQTKPSPRAPVAVTATPQPNYAFRSQKARELLG